MNLRLFHGEGNGNPLQYSCLENPMDGGAWWAAVHGVVKSRLDTTERLYFHFSLSCTGEGNGKPLQCCCLENPRDGGAWWAAVYGVAQSRTRLKRLSSSSSLLLLGLPWGLSGKNPPASAETERLGLKPWVRGIPWRRRWQPSPVFLPGESHGQRSLAGYSLWGFTKSRTVLSD